MEAYHERTISRSDSSPIGLVVGEAAKAEIELLRQFWNRQVVDPADVVVIAWGMTVRDTGDRSEGVVVSFYGKSERPDIDHGIEHVSGMEVVLFVIEPDRERFRGRMLDFNADRGFHLRP